MRRQLATTFLLLLSLTYACGDKSDNKQESPDGTGGKNSADASAGQPGTITGGQAGAGAGTAVDSPAGQGGGGGGTPTPVQGGAGGQSEDTGAAGSAPMPDDPGCTGDCGPKFDLYFAQDKIASLKIRFYSDVTEPLGYTKDRWLDLLWAKWKHCGPYDNYVPVEVEYESPDGVGNTTMRQVGMRLRGTRSRGSNDVQGFKLDMKGLLEEATGDALTRRFAGMNRVNILSVERDKSLMVQCLAAKMFRDSGAPATYCNFMKVYVNDKLYGVMPSVEESDDGRFLKHHFDTNDGSLYECSGGCEFPDSKADLEYLGDTFEGDYLTEYDPIRGEAADAEINLIPMLKCGDVDSTPDDEEFKSCIESWIDVDEWLRVIAGESLLPTVESFTGVKRNYYLYFKPEDISLAGGRFQLYSWDYDTAFHRQACYPSDCNPFTSVAGWFGPLGTRAKLTLRLEDVFRERYCAAMNSFLASQYKPEAVDAMADILAPAVEELQTAVPFKDEIYPTVKEWQDEVKTLRDFIVSHKEEVQTMVDEGCN